MPTVLATVDFSSATDGVIDAAAAWSRDATVLLLHVAPLDPDYVTYRVGPEDERDNIAAALRRDRATLQEAVARLTEAGRSAEALIVQGDPAARIVDEATRRGADVIVVGRHRHGRLHDRLVGTVAEAVLRTATCPVLVVPFSE